MAQHRVAYLTCLLLLPASTALADEKARPDEKAPSLRDRLDRLAKARPKSVPAGAIESVAYALDASDRMSSSFSTQAKAWRAEAEGFLAAMEKGKDPYPEQGGRIVNRGYWSPSSARRQGYAVYLPPNYDPHKNYPLMLVLHGGSSNGNLFLGVVLGNNMNWKRYPQFLWNQFEPRWKPNWIVVAPDGFGQIMWRWMGEDDVLDVLRDVEKHYSVEKDQVVLAGLSNGGVGAYSIGMRHAWRFSKVLAMAGAPMWQQYAGGNPSDYEKLLMQRISGPQLATNMRNTDFRMYHGRADTGPMKPRYITEFTEELKKRQIPHRMQWFEAGHDILYLVHRHGKIYPKLTEERRVRHPERVWLTTADYRARRQHWISVIRIENYPSFAEIEGVVQGERTIELTTKNTRAVVLHLAEAPVAQSGKFTLIIDKQKVFSGDQRKVGPHPRAFKEGERWRIGRAKDAGKRPGLSGPITDAYHDKLAHVYGTVQEDETATLRKAAEKGATGWPLWPWNVRQRVLADSDVTPDFAARYHLVLYGNSANNAVLQRINKRLPIQVTEKGVTLRGKTHTEKGIGTRFIYPNPEHPKRYVIVQGGVDAKAAARGHQLPDFLPDYVVYDASSTRSRSRLIFPRGRRPLDAGFFDDNWQLRGTPPSVRAEDSTLPVPKSPSAALDGRIEESSTRGQAGVAARRIAERVPTFRNYRGETPGGTWRTTPDAVWAVRSADDCLRDLRDLHVNAVTPTAPVTTPVPTPVQLQGRVGGILFESLHDDREVIVACELAARLPKVAKVLGKHGIVSAGVMSSYRNKPRSSFHTFGMALDLATFSASRGVISVQRDFVITPQKKTCPPPPHTNWRSATLAELACDLHHAESLATVLTPNYNSGHRDHFHLDIRPHDRRLFIR